ncbi:MAG: hypothetical protein EKK42_18855 [Pseudonocardiaceae bacterium]|nr:MAG: hypothetical protein EKK42_18855 [Pseudonocardiaceae bacterium]
MTASAAMPAPAATMLSETASDARPGRIRATATELTMDAALAAEMRIPILDEECRAVSRITGT